MDHENNTESRRLHKTFSFLWEKKDKRDSAVLQNLACSQTLFTLFTIGHKNAFQPSHKLCLITKTFTVIYVLCATYITELHPYIHTELRAASRLHPFINLFLLWLSEQDGLRGCITLWLYLGHDVPVSRDTSVFVPTYITYTSHMNFIPFFAPVTTIDLKVLNI